MSEGLAALRDLILKVRGERATVGRSIPDAEDEVERAEDRLRRARSWFWGLFLKNKIPERQAALEARTAELAALRARLEGTFVDADTNADATTNASYDQLVESFGALARCARIWDITGSQANDRVRTRSRASVSVERKLVTFTVADADEIIQTASRSLRLQNANGPDLVFYAGFLLMETRSELALVDLRELDVLFSTCTFTETEQVPSDSGVVGRTWAKVNKDGSPDRRFRDNYQIPIAQYAELHLSSRTGLNEQYMFSNVDAARLFAQRFGDYKAALARLGDREPKATPVQVPPNPTTLASSGVTFESVTFLDGRSAIDVDDAAQTMIGFAQLLQRDLQSLNGVDPGVGGWTQFIAAMTGVPERVRAFFARSPAAQAVQPVAMREVTKILRSVLTQLEAGLAARPSDDTGVKELTMRVRAAAAELADS
jgi:hypothetical protein